MNTGEVCHFLLQGNLPNPGIEPGSPAMQADSLPIELPGKIQASLRPSRGNCKCLPVDEVMASFQSSPHWDLSLTTFQFGRIKPLKQPVMME